MTPLEILNYLVVLTGCAIILSDEPRVMSVVGVLLIIFALLNLVVGE